MIDKARWDLSLWLKYLEESHAHQPIVLGLERIQTVGKRLGVLSFSCPVITVAGTNGKGSTVMALAKLVQAAGLKVGTYTSPHLLQFNERIQIEGCYATDEQLCAAFLQVEAARQTIALTFFEFTTLAAFVLFQPASLDLLILEVGMGGRLDAVNSVDPQLAIITAIDYDHQEYLGNTLTEIALEKAGIFRPGIPVIVGKEAQIDSLLQKAQVQKNLLYREGEAFEVDPENRTWCFHKEVIKLPFCFLPIASVSLAFAAYTILGNSLLRLPPLQQVVSCLENIGMMGRCQYIIFEGKNIILDVGHNGGASRWLAGQLAKMPYLGKKIAVWASLMDKPLSEIVAPFKAIIHTWCIGELPGVKRGASCSVLKEVLQQQGATNLSAFDTIQTAFRQAVALAGSEDLVVVFGSFYTVGAICEQLPVTQTWQKSVATF